MRTITFLAATAAAALAACGNECGFWERCNGNVREVCGDGPDQMFGRKIRSFPCEAPNGACVEVNDQLAACVVEPVATCEEGHAGTCEGTVRTYCMLLEGDGGLVGAEDCALREPPWACVLDEAGVATCAAP